MPDDNTPDLNAISARYREMNEAALMEEARAYDSLRSDVQSLLREEFARRGLEPPLIDEEIQPGLLNPVEAARYQHMAEAIFAQGSLLSAGIACALLNANLVCNELLGPGAVSDIRLQVEKENLSVAKELLSQPVPPITEEDQAESDLRHCPRCGSSNVYFKKVDRTLDVLLSIRPIWEISLNLWTCRDCGLPWTEHIDPPSPAEPVG